MSDPVYIPGYIDQICEEAESLSSYETQSAKIYGMKVAGQLGDCAVYVVNFKERYATRYTKDQIKVIEVAGKK